MGNAHALLFPIDWPEPFGLVMIEAMACGTPVVAWRCGSVPEVMEDGVTGFILDSLEEAVQAVGRVAGLDRKRCRQVFESRFTAARMAEDYLRVYRRLTGRAVSPVPGDGLGKRGRLDPARVKAGGRRRVRVVRESPIRTSPPTEPPLKYPGQPV